MAVAACSGGDSGGNAGPPPPPAERLVVIVTPRADTIAAGATRSFAADVRTTTGQPRSVAVVWSTLDPAVATVSNGTVTALAAGTTRLIARAGDAADTATLVVRPATVLMVEPNAALASVGDTVTFQATFAPPSQSAEIAWSLSDTSLAELIAPGVVRTRAEGELQVVASSGAMSVRADVSIHRAVVSVVTLAPNALSLTVGDSAVLVPQPRDAAGRTVAGRVATWQSSAPAVATVSAAGMVTARAIGGAIVTATVDGHSASGAVNVTPAPAHSVTLALPNDSLGRGRTMQAVATPFDAKGTPLAGRPQAWQSSNSSVATINAAGLITALVVGQTTISVIVDSRVASERLTVVVPVPTAIAVTPQSPVLVAGSTMQLAAEVRDQLGTPLAGQQITWQSLDATVATVDGTGRVSSLASGATDIVARSGALTGVSTLTVQSTPVASVSLTPATASVAMGGTVVFSATARDALGNVLPRRPATWQSSTLAVATISPDGVATAVSSGHATISATIGGVTASANLTVTPPTAAVVASVSLSLTPTSLAVGETATSAAFAFDSAGRVVPGIHFSFASTDPSVASVATDGSVLARAPGTATISANAVGIVGFASVTVQPPSAPVASVSLWTPRSAIIAGDSTPLTVVLRDAAGTTLAGRLVTFTSSNPAIASVTANGMVHGVSPGGVTITARSEGVAASIPLTIGAPPAASVATVTVTLNSSQLAVPQGAQATALLRDSMGNVLVGRPIAWSSSNTAVATVAQDGFISSVTPGTAVISAQSEGRSGGATLTVVTASLNLTIAGMHIQQVVQDLAGTVPLVAGRDGLLRVFVRASATNTVQPAVRVRYYNGATLIHTDMIAAPGTSVPQAINEGTLASTWNVAISASLMQPGLRILADVDPANTVAESAEGDNLYPSSGTPMVADVRAAPPFTARLVPVLQRVTSLQGDVSAANATQFYSLARVLYPLQQVDVDVRAPYTTNAPALQPNDGNGAWNQVLSELNALRAAEGSTRFYYGVVRTLYNSGIAGLGLVGGRAAIGWDFLPSGGEVLAHEVGHNFGRLHAPSCGAGGPDPSFPYAGGVIGAYGYDIASNTLLAQSTPDVMGNCEQPWISPYTFKGILAYRAANPFIVASRAVDATPRRGLMVWGRIHQGTLILEPAFEVTAPPLLPSRAGAHQLEGFGPNGERLFAFSFDVELVADHPDSMAGHFAFVVPLELLGDRSLERLRWTTGVRRVEIGSSASASGAAPSPTLERAGREGLRLRWSPGVWQGVMVRDAASGEILTIGRNGEAGVVTRGSALELILSDGTHSVRRGVRVH